MSFGNNYRNSDIGLAVLQKAAATGEAAVEYARACKSSYEC